MKKIKNKGTKSLFFCAAMGFSILTGGLSAQESESIELDDLTTVVKSGSLVAQEDALPDFADVVEKHEGSEYITPKLPDVTVQEKPAVSDANSGKKEKSVFAEGKVGGGYPALFYGDFSVYRLSGQNPFFIGFNHDSAAGYSGHSLKDGYKDSKTGINLKKTIQKNRATVNLKGDYEVLVNGLQSKVNSMSDITQNDVSGGGDFTWQFNDIFSAGASMNAEFYNRYSAITGSDSYEDFMKSVSVLGLSPSVFGNVRVNAFNIDFSTGYWLDANTDGAIAYNTKHQEAGKIANRGQFKVGVSWKNQIFKAYANVGAVLSDAMNDNYITAPFAVGGAAVFPVKFSNRKASVGLEGGLSSTRSRVSDLEKKFKFTSLTFIPQEVTDWYAQLETSLPVGTGFTVNANLSYKKTAFENGWWQPDYTVPSYKGFYGYKMYDMSVLCSNIELTYIYKILSLKAGLRSNWIDIPVLDYNQLVTLGIGLAKENGKYGVNLNSAFGLNDSSSAIVPIFNLDGFVKITEAVSIGAELTDIIKLVSGSTRTYAGDYIVRSGTASVMVKFFF